MTSSIITLKNSVFTEITKQKKTLALWGAILAPLFVVTVNFLIFFSHPELLEKAETNPWLKIAGNASNIYSILMLPLLITLLRVRESQARTGGYIAFIPWTFQPGFTPMAQSHPEQLALVPTSTYKGSIEYLRVLAICRLALNNIANFQSSWVTQGKKIGQMSLFYGANDLGSVMMEENVVSQAGVSFRLSLQEMAALVRDAGFEPAQRDNFYNVLRAA